MRNAIIALIFTVFSSSSYSQFTDPQYLAWQFPNSISFCFGDTDNDGDIDFMDYNIDIGQRLIENSGDNIFKTPVNISVDENFVIAQEMTDIDGDGDLDIIGLDNPYGKIILYTNEGDNVFTSATVYEAFVSIEAFDLFDIDGDGDMDISILISIDQAYWLKNNGDGTCTAATITDTGSYLDFPHFFDADDDGDLDASYYEFGTSSIIYFENIDGIFGTPSSISTATTGVNAIASIDTDDDGDLDLVFSNNSEDNVMMIENLGDGVFAEGVLFATHDDALIEEVIDLNLDGKMDLIISSSPGNYISWIRNLGDDSFAPSEIIFDVGGNFVAKFYDYDADGDLDYVGKSNSGSIMYFENLGDLTFSDINILSGTTYQPNYTYSMDVDGDGFKDILCGSRQDQKISWVKNLGGGDFSELRVIDTRDSLDPLYLSSADIDMDGDEDLLVASYNVGEVLWYSNLGDGNFSESNIISADAPQVVSVISDDWDMDGDMDIVASILADSRVVLYENVDGIFDPAGITLATDGWAVCLTSADIDNDGDNDISWGSSTDDHVKWLENEGGLLFTEHLVADGITNVKGLEIADIDNDGDLDMLVGSYGGDGLLGIENLGGGIFTTPITINGDVWPIVVKWADVNNDGNKDIITGEFSDNQLSWFENIGDWDFADRVSIISGAYGTQDIEVGDFDRDGDNDISYVMYSNHIFAWVQNMNVSAHSVKGRVFIDENENGIFDIDEEGVHVAQVLTSPESFYSYTSYSGEYIVAFGDFELGDYSVFPEPIDYWEITTAESYDVTIDGDYTLYEGMDFGIYPSEIVDDVEGYLIGGTPRIDTNVPYSINFSNTGSTILSGTLHLELDEQLTFLGADIVPELIDGQHIYWNYSDLAYFEDRSFQVVVAMPDFESIGDDIKSYLTVEVEEDDVVIFTDMDSLEQVIQGAYDPNDKTVRPAGEGEFGNIPPTTESLEYLVRFQNTGTDTAFLVVIKDQLDPNLDWTSLTPLAWSHDMEIEINHFGNVSFIFEDIMLPDSNINQIASNGFVKYKINLLADLPMGTSIYNTADIYFDANPAVETNTTVNTLYLSDDSGIEETDYSFFKIYPNPFSNFTTIQFSKEITEEHYIIIYDLLGNEIYRVDGISGQQVQINKSEIGSGVYLISVFNSASNQEISTAKLIAQ